MILKIYFEFKKGRLRQNIIDRGNKVIFDHVETSYVGQSMIDGNVIISIDPDDFYYVNENKEKWGIERFEHIFEINNHIALKIKKEIKRVYSEADPYGEEDWDE